MDNYVLALMLCIGDCVVAFARVCACVCLFATRVQFATGTGVDTAILVGR